MADVQIQQTPETGSGGGWVWALVVIILLAVIAWFVWGGGMHRTSTTRIDINTPGASTGGSGGGSAGGGAGGTGGSGGGTGTKTP